MDESDKAIFIGSDQGGVERSDWMDEYGGYAIFRLEQLKARIAELEASEERLAELIGRAIDCHEWNIAIESRWYSDSQKALAARLRRANDESSA